MSVSRSSPPPAASAQRPVELLAPAGCYASLQAAIQSGADAVYFGLAQLNMRARSRRSFHLKDLPEIMDRCRAANVRGYLTLNTLLYDHDLRLCQSLLDEAARQNVDAVIASDMACVLMARELGLEVHLSTQLSVSNFQSFKFYTQFCDRIVLARELSLPMVRSLHQKIVAENLRGPSGRLAEIEVFAHGALCVAVSGRCGMSLFTDNASANRGACSQNCRKEYEIVDKESGQKLLLDNQFVMSPNDLCTIDFLDQVIASGATTLKIEGRGRAPEYVRIATAAYRRAIDAIQSDAYTPDLVESLYQDLGKVYNRGHASGYYLGRKQGWAGAYGNQATRRKTHIGQVTHYYPKIGVVEILATAPLSTGDEYVIIGETTGVVSGKLHRIRTEQSVIVDSVQPGTVFSIEVPERVRLNDRVFIMTPVAASAP